MKDAFLYKMNDAGDWEIAVEFDGEVVWYKPTYEERPNGEGMHYFKYRANSTLDESLEDYCRTTRPNGCQKYTGLWCGRYAPRVYRPGCCPFESRVTTTEYRGSLTSARGILDLLDVIAKTIEIHPSNARCYGSKLRHVLLLTCMEVENAWKGILRANGYQNNLLTTRDYVKLYGPLVLKTYRVSLDEYPLWHSFKPFDGWNSTQPTQSLPWYNDYNATKHDREANLNKATLENVVTAVGAMTSILVAQYGPNCLNELHDYGLGFSVMFSEEYPFEHYYLPADKEASKWTADKIHF